MAFHYSPKTTSRGLVFCIDAANRTSYVSGSLIWNDLSSSTLSGSLINGPVYSSESYGSIVFDGTDDYVNYGNPSSLNIQRNLTMEAWVKVSSWITPWSCVGGKESMYRIARNELNNSFEFAFNPDIGGAPGSSVFVTSAFLPANRWYHTAMTYDGTTLKAYLGGIVISSTTYTGVIYTGSAQPFWIGQNSTHVNQRNWNGNIAVVKVYNEVLSEREILGNYNATKGRFGFYPDSIYLY